MPLSCIRWPRIAVLVLTIGLSDSALAIFFPPPIPGAGTVGVDYALDTFITDFTGAKPIQSEAFKNGHLQASGLHSDFASLLDADGFAVSNVSFDAANAKLGFLGHTLSGVATKSYAVSSDLTYRDGISLVTTGPAAAAAAITLKFIIDGDFAGSADSGAVTMTFSSGSQSTMLQVFRHAAGPLNPGFDTFGTTDFMGAPVTSLVATGTAMHFTESLTLTLPALAAPGAGLFINPGFFSTGGASLPGCTAQNPCGVMINGLTGATVAPLNFSFVAAVSSGSGHGASVGESLIDISHTVRLEVDTGASNVYFLLNSRGLRADTQSALLVVPTVAMPEPHRAVSLSAGLLLLILVSLSKRSHRRASLAQDVLRRSREQPTASLQAMSPRGWPAQAWQPMIEQRACERQGRQRRRLGSSPLAQAASNCGPF